MLKHKIGYCTTAKFNEYSKLAPNGSLSLSSMMYQSLKEPDDFIIVEINHRNNPLLSNPVHILSFLLPPTGHALGNTIKYCSYFNMPYIFR